MLRNGCEPQPGDLLAPEEIKDPLVLEFLALKDEYSRARPGRRPHRKLEDFLLELGGDFAFMRASEAIADRRRMTWIDLLFFHRRLRCLVVIDLKIGKFTACRLGTDAPLPELRESTGRTKARTRLWA